MGQMRHPLVWSDLKLCNHSDSGFLGGQCGSIKQRGWLFREWSKAEVHWHQPVQLLPPYKRTQLGRNACVYQHRYWPVKRWYWKSVLLISRVFRLQCYFRPALLSHLCDPYIERRNFGCGLLYGLCGCVSCDHHLGGWDQSIWFYIQ